MEVGDGSSESDEEMSGFVVASQVKGKLQRKVTIPVFPESHYCAELQL